MKLVGDVVPVRVIQDLNCKKVQSRVAEIYAVSIMNKVNF